MPFIVIIATDVIDTFNINGNQHLGSYVYSSQSLDGNHRDDLIVALQRLRGMAADWLEKLGAEPESESAIAAAAQEAAQSPLTMCSADIGKVNFVSDQLHPGPSCTLCGAAGPMVENRRRSIYV